MRSHAGIWGHPRAVAGRPAWITSGLALAAVIGLGVGFGVRALASRSAAPATNVATHFGLHGEATWAPGTHRAPAIDTLRDQTGHVFSLASLRGHSVAIVFFDSHCHQECPLEGRSLAAAEQALPRAQRPILVAISVNPQDTPASVAAATRAWGLASTAPWHWLMGTRTQLAPVWAAYHEYVSARPVDGDINHTEAAYLVDSRGDLRSGYLYPFAAQFVTDDLRVLARDRGV